MDQNRKNSGDPHDELDTPAVFDYKTGRDPSNNTIFTTSNWDTDRMVPEPSLLGESRRDPTANRSVRNVDGTGGISTLPSENHGHSHVVAPSPYSGKKEDFHGFR
jgi:hypothetical protein